VVERLENSTLGEPHNYYYALQDSVLLAAEWALEPVTGMREGRAFSHGRSLIRVGLPEFNELARVPYSLRANLGDMGPTTLVVSDDKKTFVYGLDRLIVCRNTEDLSVRWTHEIDREFGYAPEDFSITPDGDRVAAVVLDTSYFKNQRNFYIGIYAGADGKELTRVRANGSRGMALSPDGRVLAIGREYSAVGRGAVLVAELVDIGSGRLLAALEHDRWTTGADLVHATGLGLQFTPDGRHLITDITGLVKVWSLDPPLARG
jgi:hypothetical protein